MLSMRPSLFVLASLLLSQHVEATLSLSTNAMTLGTKYYVTAKGAVTAIRFWRSKHEKCNRHTGRIFTVEGKLIASLDFTEKCSLVRKGEWVTQAFHEPIELEPGLTYVVAMDYVQSGAYTGIFMDKTSQKRHDRHIKRVSTTAAYKRSVCPLAHRGKIPENIYVDIEFKPSVYAPEPRCQAWPIEPTQTLLPVDDEVERIGNADKSPISLGLKLTPLGDGAINAVRFYKPQAYGIGALPLVGKIYDMTTGLVCASVVIEDKCDAKGWVSQELYEPLRVTAGTTYMVVVDYVRKFAIKSSYFTYDMVHGAIKVGQAASCLGKAGHMPKVDCTSNNHWIDMDFTADHPEAFAPEESDMPEGGFSLSWWLPFHKPNTPRPTPRPTTPPTPPPKKPTPAPTHKPAPQPPKPAPVPAPTQPPAPAPAPAPEEPGTVPPACRDEYLVYGVKRGSYKISGASGKKSVRTENVGATEASACCATCVQRRCSAWYYDGTLRACQLNYVASTADKCDDFLEATFDLSPRAIDTLDAAGSNVCVMPTFIDSESGLPGRKKLGKPDKPARPVKPTVGGKLAAATKPSPVPVKAPK